MGSFFVEAAGLAAVAWICYVLEALSDWAGGSGAAVAVWAWLCDVLGLREEVVVMEYLIGLGLAMVVCLLAKVVGFDKERVFYPTMTWVVATYYILFAVMGNSMQALAWESLVAIGFVALAVVGFQKNLWLVVAALAGHGAFDLIHHWVIENHGVPGYWPGFCMSFDVMAAGILAVLLKRRHLHAVNT
jgi:hypothetical protein